MYCLPISYLCGFWGHHGGPHLAARVKGACTCQLCLPTPSLDSGGIIEGHTVPWGSMMAVPASCASPLQFGAGLSWRAIPCWWGSRMVVPASCASLLQFRAGLSWRATLHCGVQGWLYLPAVPSHSNFF